MRLKFNQTMASAVEQLVIDPQSRFLEMKSLQPYSTTDEYLYAMKEDLADWLSNMYPNWCPITAENFIECLENGALICQHANNVNEAARKHSSLISLTNCKYRSDARPQTFTARDNVSQFVNWARHVAGVREVLMFESDDLILRKNEKNFILCLLEIARFGAKFGLSVPAIIKLEVEIEREIERDKQTGILSFAELKRLQREQQQEEENQRNKVHLIDDEDNQTNKNLDDTFSISESDGANLLKQHLIDENSNRKQNNDENLFTEVNTTIITSNEETEYTRTLEEDEEENRRKSRFNQTLEEDNPIESQFDRTTRAREKPVAPPPSSSHLHKTVVHIANACCCSQRFPVIQIGEGKYRIGENGTIIFIRILRNHVMVRVGGGWDTLENYLNKHDPCRRSGHHRSEHHNHNHHQSDIPILAMTNPNISPSVQKNTPYGKSVTIKTEEFPLSKPSVHDTNLVDAQLVITRGADGRHRIGQITYKSEEDTLNQPSACPHHHNHNHSPPTITKVKTVRNTGRSTPLSIYNKQSSPSTDQDYSSLTETTPSKPSSSSSLDFKEESIEEPTKSFTVPTMDDLTIEHYSPIKKSQTEPLIPINSRSFVIESTKTSNKKTSVNFKQYRPIITESVIDTIDPLFIESKRDFDINDIEDVMGLNKKPTTDEDTTNIDNDSLDSSEGVIEEKKKPSLPPTPRKSSGYSSTHHIAQKQKTQQEQTVNRKRSSSNNSRISARLSILPNVVGGTKKEETVTKPRRKLLPVAQRSKSSELIDKINDISKLDRDSGFDEQDFRRERLHSNGDDNSSVSSMKSARSSTALSVTNDYRQNKSYELRMKKLDLKRNSNEKESSAKTGRTSNTPTSRRGSELVTPILPSSSTTNKYRKNSQPVVNLK